MTTTVTYTPGSGATLQVTQPGSLASPSADILTVSQATSTTGVDGTGSATTTAAALASHACRYAVVQNDPSSTVNLLVGYTTTPTIVLIPGSSFTFYISNTNLINVKSASSTATYNFTAAL